MKYVCENATAQSECRTMKAKGVQGIMGRFLFGIVVGVLLVPLVVITWFHFGTVPVAVTDPPLPQERLITSVPLNARIDREMVKTPPIQASEQDLVAGAHIYSEQCAVCHGFHGQPSKFGTH